MILEPPFGENSMILDAPLSDTSAQGKNWLENIVPFGLKVILTLAIIAGFDSSALAQTESAPTLRTATVLPGVALSGPGYTIGQSVQNNRAINTFTVTVDGKPYQVRGNALMRERLVELVALQHLKAIKGTDVYKQSLEKAATGPLRTAKNMVTDPVDTLEGMGRGVGTFFRNIGHSAFGGASEQESGVLKTALGYDAAKRKFAYKVGIDPYTSFPPVAKELGDIAWAGVAGGLTVSAGFAAIPGVGGTVVSGTKFGDAMNRIIRNNTPAELKKINAGKLRAMKIHEDVADLFLDHPKLSPTRKTRIVGAIAQMGIYGRQIFIERAIHAADDQEAFQIQYWAELSAAYHTRVKPVQTFVSVGRRKAPIMQRADGMLIAIVPVDYAAWTGNNAAIMDGVARSLQQVKHVTGKEMWLDGYASPMAKNALTKLRWKVIEDAGRKLRAY